MILFYTLYGMACVYIAFKDAGKIKADKAVDHFRNGATHLAVASIFAFFYGWYHFIGVLCLARLVFDTSLNLFRRFNPFYVSINPASWVDRLEKRVFGTNKLLADILYLVVLLTIWFFG